MKSITLSLYIKTIKTHSKNHRKSSQDILGFLFDLISEDGCTVESTTSSRIMTGEYDVPYHVREAYNKKSEADKTKISDNFIDYMVDESSMDRLVEAVKWIVAESDVSNKTKTNFKSEDNDHKVLSSFLSIAIITDNRKILDEILYKSNNGIMRLISGDIIAIGFNKKLATTKRIVVIPVDDKFTMILDSQDGESIISKDTIHGKWLMRAIKLGYDTQNIKYLKSYEHVRIGTCPIGKTEFYLLPVSTLKERHKAESNSDIISKAIDALVHEYNISGQGTPLYIPLIGTGRSRANLTLNESINLIRSAFIKNKDGFFGDVKIVVGKELIDEVEHI